MCNALRACVVHNWYQIPLAFIKVFWTLTAQRQVGAHPGRAGPSVVCRRCPPRAAQRGENSKESAEFEHGLTDPAGRECAPKQMLKPRCERCLGLFPSPLPRWHSCTHSRRPHRGMVRQAPVPFVPGVLRQTVCSLCKT